VLTADEATGQKQALMEMWKDEDANRKAALRESLAAIKAEGDAKIAATKAARDAAIKAASEELEAQRKKAAAAALAALGPARKAIQDMTPEEKKTFKAEMIAAGKLILPGAGKPPPIPELPQSRVVGAFQSRSFGLLAAGGSQFKPLVDKLAEANTLAEQQLKALEEIKKLTGVAKFA
jgi:hypothetical protein